MSTKTQRVELLLEAEKRGILPPQQLSALNEARRRGIIVSGDARAAGDANIPTGKRVRIGAGRGLIDVVEGLKQLGLMGTEAVGLSQGADAFTAKAQEERELFDRGDLGLAGGAGRLAGNIAATAAPVMGAARVGALVAPRLAAASTQTGGRALASRGVINTAAGGTGGAVQFAQDSEQRLDNTVFGGAAGLVGGEAVTRLTRRLSLMVRQFKGERGRSARFDAAKEELRGKVPDDMLDNISGDIADGFTPEQAMRKVQVESLGATPTRAQVTGNLDDLNFELEQLRRAGPVAARDTANRGAVLENLENRTRGPADAFDTGVETRETLKRGRARIKKRETKAFDEAGEIVEQLDSVTVAPVEIGKVINEVKDNFGLNELNPVVRVLRRNGIIDEADNLVSGAKFSAREAEMFRRALNRASAKREAKMVVGRLRRALNSDIGRDVGQDVFAKARGISSQRFAQFDDQMKIAKLLDGSLPPERLVKDITNQGFGVEGVGKFFQTLAGVNPSIANKLRGAVMDDIFSSVKSGSTDATGVPFLTPAMFSRRLASIGRAKLNAIYGQKGANDILLISNIMKDLFAADRRALNPGTANELMNRLSGAVGRVVEIIPGGRFITGLARAAKSGSNDIKMERKVRRALNLVTLKSEEILKEIGLGAQPAIAAGLGSVQAQ